MEETEEEAPLFQQPGQPSFASEPEDVEAANEHLLRLYELTIRDREVILADEQLSNREKRKLLENNRLLFAAAKGRTIRYTENVARNLLVFAGILIVILALLNVFAQLPTDITLAFLGTTLGGAIATIAQKIGNL
jgi:hypothetical protein